VTRDDRKVRADEADFERYVHAARIALFFARSEASELGSLSIGTEHFLLGIIRAGDETTDGIFERAQLSADTVRAALGTPRPWVPEHVEMPINAEGRQALIDAQAEAARLGDNVSSVHLLLGVLRQEKSIAATVLAQYGVTVDGVRDEVARRSRGGNLDADVR